MTLTNPFKFGSVVDVPYFTNRTEEIRHLKQTLQGPNHVILISPRRFGKTSLMLKVLDKLDRPYVFLDLQIITDVNDLATQLLKRIYRIYPFERLKQLVKNFQIVPNLTINPVNNDVEISFQPAETSMPMLEDVLNTLDLLGTKEKCPILVFDEFQEINRLGKHLPGHMRAVMQHHQNINYAFMGSMESRMKEIFEQKKSPFYHFGQLMLLNRIPKPDFQAYLNNGFESSHAGVLTESILDFTQCHPYYTQQLASTIWELSTVYTDVDILFSEAISRLIQIHDADYERLWQMLNPTDRKVMISLSQKEQNILTSTIFKKYNIKAASTVFSSLKRLMAQGYVIKMDSQYELDDPFFAQWINQKRKY